MLIKQERINEKLVEIRTTDFHGITLYYIELREEAGNWNYPWEIREDGTRPIIGEYRKTFEEAEKVFSEYVTKAGA